MYLPASAFNVLKRDDKPSEPEIDMFYEALPLGDHNKIEVGKEVVGDDPQRAAFLEKILLKRKMK